jgi:hypothetical protein
MCLMEGAGGLKMQEDAALGSESKLGIRIEQARKADPFIPEKVEHTLRSGSIHMTNRAATEATPPNTYPRF